MGFVSLLAALLLWLLAIEDGAELDNFDKLLVVVHVGSMGLYTVGALWIKTSLARAQKAVPPAQAAIIGRIVGFDFTILSWVAFVGVGVSGYILLARGDLADPVAFYTLFLDPDLLDSAYGWKLLVMMVLWALLVVSGAIMTFVFRPMLESKLKPSDPPEALEKKQRQLALSVKAIDHMAWLNLALAIGAFLAGYALSFDRTILR